MKEDNDLLVRACGGDTRAFETLVKSRYDKYFAFALSFSGGNYNNARDVLQNALLKSFIAIKKFKMQSSFDTWMWKIIKNEYVASANKKNVRNKIYAEDLSYDFEDVSVNHVDDLVEMERHCKLYELLGEMPLKYREAIVLIDINELSYEDASVLAGVSKTAICSRYLRGRKMLFTLMEKHSKWFV